MGSSTPLPPYGASSCHHFRSRALPTNLLYLVSNALPSPLDVVDEKVLVLVVVLAGLGGHDEAVQPVGDVHVHLHVLGEAELGIDHGVVGAVWFLLAWQQGWQLGQLAKVKTHVGQIEWRELEG